jgi:transcriptional regulator GlxA family with amidase domain
MASTPVPGPPIRVAILGYDGLQALDLVGPADAFTAANDAQPGAYRVVTVSLDGLPFVTESGLKITPDSAIGEALPVDTLIIPGGAGLRKPALSEQVAAAIAGIVPQCRRVVSICTGLFGLAPTRLLDGCEVTTHWRYANEAAARFPALRMNSDRIFIKQGMFYTAAGVTAAIDVSLALIEEDYGARLGLAVARDLVVYLKRSGGQRQYSVPLEFQARAGDRFAELMAWIVANLSADLSVEALAARVRLSPRQFARRFAQVFGATPAELVETLRLDAARDHLMATRSPVDAIAAIVGFRSDDVFRRAFDRHFGVSPTEYRQRFSSTVSSE